MTKSPNKAELNAGEMPAEILVAWSGGSISTMTVFTEIFDEKLKDRSVKYIREDIAMSEHCGYKNATMAMFNGHVPSMIKVADETLRAATEPKVSEDSATRDDLRKYGFCEGNYTSKCLRCGTFFDWADKRSNRCKPCAEKLCEQDKSKPVINDAGLTNDYNEWLHKCVMRFGAEFRSMEECRDFEVDVLRIVEEKAINNIPINDKTIHEMACAYEAERARYLGGIAKYPANGDAFIGCMKKALINHAVKGEKVAEMTETELLYILGMAFGNLPVTEAMPQTWRSVIKLLASKYPSGIKIIDGGA